MNRNIKLEIMEGREPSIGQIISVSNGPQKVNGYQEKREDRKPAEIKIKKGEVVGKTPKIIFLKARNVDEKTGFEKKHPKYIVPIPIN